MASPCEVTGISEPLLPYGRKYTCRVAPSELQATIGATNSFPSSHASLTDVTSAYGSGEI